MPRNFDAGSNNSKRRSREFVVRVILGVLLLANLVAAGLVLFPPGGSAEDLDRQLVSLQTQVTSKQALLERSQRHSQAVERGRSEGDQFVNDYFLGSRTAFSTLAGELDSAATSAKIVQKDHGYSYEPIDGSDTLSVMNVTAQYEGAYPDLMHFVHEIDKSPRLLIIESLSAAPQQGSDKLSVSMKLDTLVREDGAGGQ
jgi:type IV pilus assembly protein PilO